MSGPKGINPQTLLNLARDNIPDAIRATVEAGAPVDFANAYGQTGMHVASIHGHLEAVQAFLDCGIDVNVTNSRGQTALHFAARAHKNVRPLCELLLRAGADEGLADAEGRLAFELAEDGDVRALLGGPNPRLFETAAAGDVAGLRAVFEEDPDHDPDVESNEGLPPLHLAARGGHLGAVGVLLGKGADAGRRDGVDGDTALHHAVRGGHAMVVMALVRGGAPLDVRNYQNSQYASGQWNSAGERLLPFHQTPLHVAAEAGDAELAAALLLAGAKPDLPDFDGKTPLHHALEAQDDDLAELLIKNGADVNRGCKDFASPLPAAAGSGATATLRLLLAAGAAPGVADEQGWTPLLLAARAGRLQAVQALLAAGADTCAATRQGGNTALHVAALNGRADIVTALLAAAPGAAGARNSAGALPSEVAKSPEVAALFPAQPGDSAAAAS